MKASQLIAWGIFWIAGAAIIYFWLRKTELSIWQNLRELWWLMLGGGAIAGFMLFQITLLTTR